MENSIAKPGSPTRIDGAEDRVIYVGSGDGTEMDGEMEVVKSAKEEATYDFVHLGNIGVSTISVDDDDDDDELFRA
ncbi:hypothetical protein K7X08_035776 [Anisodus acutangulus]|uniref:Uncharacterized protein n=1 Tax=Anisodus acutangulus TaxID=402998 RepID=A0A9Q1QWA2_9SOLA|nr:hypothetical protein K7X08_035776 [Anisodus acutangulus]